MSAHPYATMLHGQAWPAEHIHQRYTPPKLAKGKYFIDIENETACTANEPEAAHGVAAILQRENPGAKIVVRYWEETEEEAEKAYQQQRKERWETIIYK